jgi:hypothetical protein
MSVEQLAAYLEGEVTASVGAEVEREVAASAVARERLDRLRQIRTALSNPVPELERFDLVAGIRDRIRVAAPLTGAPPQSRTMGWTALVVAACVGGAATAAGFALVQTHDEFRSKSAANAAVAPERWAGVQAYRVSESRASERLGEQLGRGDGLAFSYTNLGPQPFEYLMIFGVDGGGEVRWIEPAYDRTGTNPGSIPLEKGRSEVAIPDVVRHDFAPGPLVIYAVFSHRMLHVLEVESVVGGPLGTPSRLPFVDTAQETVITRVER